jgi:hypothetical protein
MIAQSSNLGLFEILMSDLTEQFSETAGTMIAINAHLEQISEIRM